uniref:Uncharacterized protein n=1 Tax=Arion vulgaris TaxID=1028688 RepID=A0A0B7B644_9EUPU
MCLARCPHLTKELVYKKCSYQEMKISSYSMQSSNVKNHQSNQRLSRPPIYKSRKVIFCTLKNSLRSVSESPL